MAGIVTTVFPDYPIRERWRVDTTLNNTVVPTHFFSIFWSWGAMRERRIVPWVTLPIAMMVFVKNVIERSLITALYALALAVSVVALPIIIYNRGSSGFRAPMNCFRELAFAIAGLGAAVAGVVFPPLGYALDESLHPTEMRRIGPPRPNAQLFKDAKSELESVIVDIDDILPQQINPILSLGLLKQAIEDEASWEYDADLGNALRQYSEERVLAALLNNHYKADVVEGKRAKYEQIYNQIPKEQKEGIDAVSRQLFAWVANSCGNNRPLYTDLSRMAYS